MKAVILAGGLGTRLAEETELKPKPMVEIGGKPIIWHIMKTYSHYGINDFIVCCGYKGYVIKQYFANYFMHMSDITIDIKSNTIEVHQNNLEPWKVTLIDTGEHTQTGGRIKRIQKFVRDDEAFCLTYGDGLCNINLAHLVDFHFKHKMLATITAVRPPGRFGALKVDADHIVRSFEEKPFGDGGWINGGFFVLNPKVIDSISADDCIWEREPLSSLALSGQLAAFLHDGFWQPMDTLREKLLLNKMWDTDSAPWKVWE